MTTKETYRVVPFKHTYKYLNEENNTFKFEKRHVSATPVPTSVYGWNYNYEQYIAENYNNNDMIQQLITKKD